jgi:putative flavoprotein involved in K+ transport
LGKSVTVAVIGAGQAGLAVGYYLTRAGIDNVIIDAAQAVGDSWRNRWDTLRLFTPAKYDSLPGLPFPAPAGSFPTKDQTAAYLQVYAEHHNLRIRLGHRVDRLRRDGMGFVLTVDNETIHATYVVVATGAHQTKRVPPIATGLDETIHQIHAGDYRNPGQLRPGPVLVVGAGNSGTELAIEAANAGHQTYLAGKSPRQMPKVAKLFDGWLFWFLVTRVLSLHNPIGRKIRPQAQTHGGPLIRLTAKDAQFAGVESVGRVMVTQNGRPTLADGRQIEAANVLWCTGFGHDFSWIDLPGIRPDALPNHERGVSSAQKGLYFVGLPFLTTLASAFLGGVDPDARFVVDDIRSEIASSSNKPVPSGSSRPRA